MTPPLPPHTGDLRLLLCGNATECPHLRASEWTLTSFLQRYFKAPEMLVQSNDPSVRDLTRTLEESIDHRDANPPSLDQSEFERQMWEVNSHAPYASFSWKFTKIHPLAQDNPWVVCSKEGNCTGSISKVDWLNNRGGTCKDTVVDYLRNNPGALAVEMDLCNLNSQMDGLCKKILEKVLEIGSANCLASGNDACLDKSFFYTPSTFSSSNQQVVIHLHPPPP